MNLKCLNSICWRLQFGTGFCWCWCWRVSACLLFSCKKLINWTASTVTWSSASGPSRERCARTLRLRPSGLVLTNSLPQTGRDSRTLHLSLLTFACPHGKRRFSKASRASRFTISRGLPAAANRFVPPPLRPMSHARNGFPGPPAFPHTRNVPGMFSLRARRVVRSRRPRYSR